MDTECILIKNPDSGLYEYFAGVRTLFAWFMQPASFMLTAAASFVQLTDANRQRGQQEGPPMSLGSGLQYSPAASKARLF